MGWSVYKFTRNVSYMVRIHWNTFEFANGRIVLSDLKGLWNLELILHWHCDLAKGNICNFQKWHQLLEESFRLKKVLHLLARIGKHDNLYARKQKKMVKAYIIAH